MVGEGETIDKEADDNWFWECGVRETVWGNPFHRELRSGEESADKTKFESTV